MQHPAYCIGAGELLFCGDDGARPLCCVECGFALDDCLAQASSTACTGLAANASDGVPVLIGHVGYGVVVMYNVKRSDCGDGGVAVKELLLSD